MYHLYRYGLAGFGWLKSFITFIKINADYVTPGHKSSVVSKSDAYQAGQDSWSPEDEFQGLRISAYFTPSASMRLTISVCV